MLAWHGDPALKSEVSARMLQHRIEDSIIQGVYQDVDPALASQYRGCLIGCTLPQQSQKYGVRWHKRVEQSYGIPEALACLLDGVFESLPVSRAAWFAVSTIEAIPVGADLTGVARLLGDDMVAEAKRGRKKLNSYGYEEQDAYPSWLWDTMHDFYGEYSLPVMKKKAVWLAERVLKHLSEAPVVTTEVTETPEAVVPQVHITTTEEINVCA